MDKFSTESRGTTCECTEDGTVLTCSDVSCPTCNRDGSVCALNTEYGFVLEDGKPVTWHSKYDYLDDGDDLGSATLDYTLADRSCVVAVNGVECNLCLVVSCPDSFRSWYLDCSNIEGLGGTLTCGDSSPDGDPILTGGPLSAFEAADPLHRSGCYPSYSVGIFERFGELGG